MVAEGLGLVGVVKGVDGLDGESFATPPRTAPALPELPELNRLSPVFSRDGVGEFRCEAKSSFLRSASRRLRILTMTSY